MQTNGPSQLAPSLPWQKHSPNQLSCLMIWLGLFVTLVGCNRGLIQASKLPPQYAAPYYPSTSQIDLSQLSNEAAAEEVASGDLLAITISTGIEEEQEPAKIRVTESGSVNVPIVGQVQVAGLTLDQAEQLIREESIRRRIYVNPVVTLTREERLTRNVAVFGAVANPGMYEIPGRNCNLAAAISAAGGLTGAADMTVEIRKPVTPESQIQTVGYQESGEAMDQSTGSISIDMTSPETIDQQQFDLVDGSVVMVKEKKPSSFL